MTNNNIADLQNMDLGKTLIDEDLSKYTTYKVGGKVIRTFKICKRK